MLYMDTLGARLKAERELAGLTQEALGKAAGVKKQTISQIELGKTGVGLQTTMEPICRRLGLNPHWLQTGKGPKYVRDMMVGDSPASMAADVMRLKAIVSVMLAAMVQHRPEEAQDVVYSIRNGLDQSLIDPALSTLIEAAEAFARARAQVAALLGHPMRP